MTHLNSTFLHEHPRSRVYNSSKKQYKKNAKILKTAAFRNFSKCVLLKYVLFNKNDVVVKEGDSFVFSCGLHKSITTLRNTKLSMVIRHCNRIRYFTLCRKKIVGWGLFTCLLFIISNYANFWHTYAHMITWRKETFLSFRLICLTDAMLIWQCLISNKRIILSYNELGRANTNS